MAQAARLCKAIFSPRAETRPTGSWPGSTYFITYRCVRGVVLSEEQRLLVLSNWIHWHGKRYLLHAAVVMPDHVHVLITPKSKPDSSCFSLEEILHTNKSYTAHEIAKSARRRGSTGRTSGSTALSAPPSLMKSGTTWRTTR
ncbi:hypothetical protein HS125_04130 [bacterium]|nr:hypothetical protein [bacterium]